MFIFCCVITVSLSRVLNYVLIRPNVFVPDVKESEISRFVVVLQVIGILSGRDGSYNMCCPVTTLFVTAFMM